MQQEQQLLVQLVQGVELEQQLQEPQQREQVQPRPILQPARSALHWALLRRPTFRHLVPVRLPSPVTFALQSPVPIALPRAGSRRTRLSLRCTCCARTAPVTCCRQERRNERGGRGTGTRRQRHKREGETRTLIG